MPSTSLIVESHEVIHTTGHSVDTNLPVVIATTPLHRQIPPLTLVTSSQKEPTPTSK